MNLADTYTSEKERYLAHCTRCGLCAHGCPILQYTDASGASPRDIQTAVYDCVADGMPHPLAYTKAFSCMECFKCVAGMCPEGLNPMLVNVHVKSQYITAGLAMPAYGDTNAPDSAHRVLASIQVSASDYRRITTPSAPLKARRVFFPGCNVYFQPEKILNALDIIDSLGDDFAYLPGLDFCCGDALTFLGDIEGGSMRVEALVTALAAYAPETVILWCPTCHCHFETAITKAMDVPFEVMSFPQYLAANMERLTLTDGAAGTVTLHEPCKSAYTGVDRDGVRSILNRLPGVVLREMPRHGKKTACCGSGAACYFPDADKAVREARLQEAAATGANCLVTVCHYCNQSFAAHAPRYGMATTNYVDLVARALGIEREETFLKWARWKDAQRILSDAAPRIAASPFSTDRIAKVVQAVFGDTDN